MARRRKGRPIDGVLVLDKPSGLSSNAALQHTKRLFSAAKAGHTGSLDPLATGVLPLCFGEATKLSHFALEADKTYVVTAKLGQRTSTSDAEGEVVEERPIGFTDAQLSAALEHFTGEQAQSPSMFSALKHEGRPLYYYARQGIDVPRKSRTITIHKITLLELKDDLLTLEVTCSKGTYIRTLVDDMGQYLGCGAHVQALRRTWIEGVVGDMVTPEELAAKAAQCDPESGDFAALDALLLPCDAVIQQIPEVFIEPADAPRFTAGNPAQAVNAEPQAEDVILRVKTAGEEQLLGLGFWRDNKIMPKRVLSIAKI